MKECWFIRLFNSAFRVGIWLVWRITIAACVYVCHELESWRHRMLRNIFCDAVLWFRVDRKSFAVY